MGLQPGAAVAALILGGVWSGRQPEIRCRDHPQVKSDWLGKRLQELHITCFVGWQLEMATCKPVVKLPCAEQPMSSVEAKGVVRDFGELSVQ